MRSVPTAKEMRSRRERVARQFEQECIRLAFVVERSLPNFRYILRDTVEGQTYKAMILVSSFDYYEYRLNVGKKRVDMLIVQQHNAVVPAHVVSLRDVTKYAPLDVPRQERQAGKKNTEDDARLLLSKYILNFESAQAELAAMTSRSRQRYKRKRDLYLKPRIGRPWAS